MATASQLTIAATLARDETFRDKVLVAVITQARITLVSTGPDDDLVRAGYARSVLQNPLNYQESFAWAMAADEAIVAQAVKKIDDITDAMLMQRVSVAWEALIRPLGSNPIV